MKKTLFLSQTKAAEEFVCDGSGFFRGFFRAKSTGTVAADKSHAVSGLCLRNVADVDDKLVHADISDYMRLFSPYKNGEFFAGKGARDSVGVTDGDSGDTHRDLCPEVSSVADTFARFQFSYGRDAGTERKNRTQRKLFKKLGSGAAQNAVQSDAEARIIHG